MLGYPTEITGYILWCIESGKGKVIINRDVVFREEVMPYLKIFDARRILRSKNEEEMVQDNDEDKNDTEVKVEDNVDISTSGNELSRVSIS